MTSQRGQPEPDDKSPSLTHFTKFNLASGDYLTMHNTVERQKPNTFGFWMINNCLVVKRFGFQTVSEISWDTKLDRFIYKYIFITLKSQNGLD